MCDPDPQGSELGALVGPFWSADKVCASLGVTGDVLATQQETGEVLGLVTRDGETLFPVFQFQRRDDQVEVRPPFVPMFQILRGFDGWAIAVLVYTPSPELNGISPLDWVRQGQPAHALNDLSSAVAREWSRGGSTQE